METLSIQQTTRTQSTKALWTGRVISWLSILFLLVDAIMKIIGQANHVEGSAKLGFQESLVQPIGIVLLICTVFYIIPRTAMFGAILLTAYLGGATAVMVQNGQPVYFPVVFGALVWGALYLRDAKLRSLVPFRKED
jgi:hypothetical protein